VEAEMSLSAIHVQDLVKAQLYESEDQVIQEAFRYFLLNRPDLRVLVAVYRYRVDPELSLARAAAIAGVSLERMKEILDHHGVPLRLGPATVEQARAEAATLEAWLETDSD
jgi:predicted HTH domain antitoxin